MYKYHGAIYSGDNYYKLRCDMCDRTIPYNELSHYIDTYTQGWSLIVCSDCFPIENGVQFTDRMICRAITMYNNIFFDTFNLWDFLKLVKAGQIEV